MAEQAPPPLPTDLTLFAKTTFRGEEREFGIKQEDRRKHVYAIGKTGMGKTTMLQNMIISDINAGHGVAIVDPHGDIAEDILDFIPPHRLNDVVYFNPADLDFPIAFNVFQREPYTEGIEHEHVSLIASGLVSVFQKLYGESWGPRLEYILRNTILALLEYPEATLLGVLRMLSDEGYRTEVVSKINDPVIKAYWENEFASYNDKLRVDAISPIQNKVGQFLSSPIIRNIVGQAKSSFDLRDIMDNKKILIMSLSKGKIGEDNARLLGSLMTTKIQLAAMSRAYVKEEERNDFYLYVDEFQNFATESFANILSEARKYRLNLTLAHQYIEQVPEEVRDAVFGNMGTLIVFRVGALDAEYLEKEFDPEFLLTDLVNLPSHHIYLKLMIDGLASRGFSGVTLPRLDQYRFNGREKAIKISRERYGNPREEVEENIKRWSGREFEKVAFHGNGRGGGSGGDRRGGGGRGGDRRGGRDGGQRTEKRDDREMFNAVCDSCNKIISVPFKPDPLRPIYCKECMPDIQRSKDSLRAVGALPPDNNADKARVPARTERSSRDPQPKRETEPVTLDVPDAVSLQDALKPVQQKMRKRGKDN